MMIPISATTPISMPIDGGYIGSIAATHPAFAGHFAGNPITPGVVMLNQIALAFGRWKPGARICAWPLVKFISPLRPDEVFTIQFTDGANHSARFTMIVGARVAASGQCQFALEATALQTIATPT